MRRNGYLAFVGVLFVFTLFCGPLKLYFRGTVAVGAILALMYIASRDIRTVFNRFFAALLLLFFVKHFTDLTFGDGVTGRQFYVYVCDMIVMPLVALGIVSCFLKDGDYKNFRRFVLFSFIVLGIFLLATIRARIGASRASISFAIEKGSVELLADAYEDTMSGALGYQSIHAVFLLFPGLVYLFRLNEERKMRWCYIGYAVLLLGALIRSGFAAATLFGMVLLAMSFLTSRKNRALTISLLIVGGLIFFILWKIGVVAAVLTNVRELIPEETIVRTKIDELILTSSGNVHEARDMSSRQAMIQHTWRLFLTHPIFGGIHHAESCDGHNYLLDYLSQYGIFGMSIWSIFYWSVYRYYKRILPKDLAWHYSIAFFMFLVVLFFKANALKMQNAVMLMMLPSLFMFRRNVFYYASNRVRRMYGMRPLFM